MDWQALMHPLTEADASDMFALEQQMLAGLPSPRWYYASDEAELAASAREGHACGIRVDGCLIALNILVPAAQAHDGGYAAILGLNEPNTINFEDVMVAPDFRRQGIHSAFLARSVSRARQMGCTSILATVDPENMPSLCAFERFGFTRTALRDTYDGRPRVFLRFALGKATE